MTDYGTSIAPSCLRWLLVVLGIAVLAIPAAAQCESTPMAAGTPTTGGGVILYPTIRVEVFTNGALVATYYFTRPNYQNIIWITENGMPFDFNGVGNPDGVYDRGTAAAIADALCGGHVNTALPPEPSGAAGSARATVSASVPAFGQAAITSVSADFNGDGTPDFAIAYEGFIRVNLYNASGSVMATQSYLDGSAAAGAIVSADFNGDGIPDLATTILLN